MTLPVRDANGDNLFPNAHITLQEEDSVGTNNNIIGLNLVTSGGDVDETAIVIGNYPTTATQIRQGTSKYADATLPNVTLSQEDWAGGRGQLWADDDETRYYDGNRIDTQLRGKMILGPLDHFVERSDHANCGYAPPSGNKVYSYNPEGVQWYKLYPAASGGDTLYLSGGVGAWIPGDISYNLIFWARKIGTPGDLVIGQCESSTVTGLPGSEVNTHSVSAAGWEYSDDRIVQYHVTWVTRGAIITSPQYQVSFYGDPGDDDDNHWEIAVDVNASAGSVGNYTTPMATSEDGITWTLGTKRPYHIIYADYSTVSGKYFDYKRGLYYVSEGTKVFIGGDRGVADSNISDVSKLYDATKSWVTNQFIGSVVVITAGPGVGEYRTVTANTSTTITVSSIWSTLHTTSTEYVIIGSHVWDLIDTLSYNVTDVAVIGDNIFFAHGDTAGITRARHTLDGTWETYSESVKADVLTVYNDYADGKTYLVGGTNDHNFYGAAVWKAWVPQKWIDENNTSLGVIEAIVLDVKKSGDWIGYSHASVTASLSERLLTFTPSGSQSGHFGIKPVEPVDVSKGNTRIGFFGKISTGTYSGLKVKLGNHGNDGSNEYKLANVFAIKDQTASPFSVVMNSDGTWQTFSNVALEDDAYISKISFAAADKFYIGASDRFNNIEMEFQTANTTAATLTWSVWDGKDWLDITSDVTDGTITTGKPYGQDGTVVIDLTTTATRQWGLGSDDSTNLDQSKYWIQVSTDTTLFANTRVERMWVQNSITDGAQRFSKMSIPIDGDTGTTQRIYRLKTNGYLYVGAVDKFSEIKFNIDGSNVNASSATMTAEYYDGEKFTSVTITDGTASGGVPFAQDGSITFAIPLDWVSASIEGSSMYWLRLDTSATLDEFGITEVSVKNDSWLTMTIAEMDTEWRWFEQDISIAATDDPIITAVSFYANTGTSAVISIYDGVYLMSAEPQYFDVPDERINNLIVYGDNVPNVWVITERTLYELQSEAGNKLIEIPLSEIGSLRGLENGQAATVNDVFLLFNIGGLMQRYFNRSLENVAWTREEGLPETRQGKIVKLVSAPGRWYALVSTRDTGHSLVMVYNNGGWHEFWRGPADKVAWDMTYQNIEGSAPNRLWIALDGLMLYLPIPSELNPLNDTNYKYTPEGHVITSWYTGGPLGLSKLWRTITVFAENLASSTPKTYVRIEYQTNSGDIDGTWTEVDGDFDTGYSVERNLGATNASTTAVTSVTGYRIRFRVRLFTEDVTTTPVLNSYLSKSILNYPPQFSIQFAAKVADGGEYYADDSGNIDPTQRVEDVLATLKSWSTHPPVSLRMRSVYSTLDNIKVLLQPISERPIMVDSQTQEEQHVFQFSLIEISDTATVD